MTDIKTTTTADDGDDAPRGHPKEEELLEQAEQEAIRLAETVADATEDAAQPKPLNAPGKEAS